MENLIIKNLLQKLIKSGKKHKSFSIYKKLLLLYKYKNLTDKEILIKIILNLLVPIKFKSKKLGVINYEIPNLVHFYKSIIISLNWFIKSSKLKSKNKISIDKSLYLESLNILKNQGNSINLKKNYIQKALVNRIFIHLLSVKKNTLK